MPSRRRSRSKNLGTSLSDVQRRMRYLERRPVRTKLQRKIVTAVNIAPETITPDEVNFGTAVITTETDTSNVDILNPKDGLLVVSSTNGSSSVYSGDDDNYYSITDPLAQESAEQAALDAAAAQDAADQAALDAADALASAEQAAQDAEDAKNTADTAELSANKRNTVFRGPTQPTANGDGDIWFDTTPVTKDGVTDFLGSRPKRWSSATSTWVAFGLNYAAITSLDADTITTGTLVGRTVKTSASGNRVEMSNTDVITFFGTADDTVGTIQPGFLNQGLYITAGTGGSQITMTGTGYSADSSASILTSGGLGLSMFDTSEVGGLEFGGDGGVIINGGGSTSDSGLRMSSGGGGFEFIDWSGSVYGTTIYAYQDILSLNSGIINIGASSHIKLSGDLVLGFGTYQQGSGAPSGTPPGGEGTVVFRYT